MRSRVRFMLGFSANMALLLREADVNRLVNMDDILLAVERVEKAYAEGGAFSNPRDRVRLPGGMLHLMAGAFAQEKVVGFKVYASFGRAPLRMKVLLYNSENGALEAVVEGNRLGQLRTGAATAIACKFMARPEAAVLAILGTGFQAAGQLEALVKVRPIREVRAYSRSPEARREFSERMSAQLGVAVAPAGSAQAAVAGADLIVTATNSREPVLEGRWLAEGMHVSAVGANSLLRREIDGQVVGRAGRIVVDSIEQAKRESSALVLAVEAGHLRWEQLGELRQLVSGQIQGRESVSEITLFQSMGSVAWDLAAAAWAVRRAREQDVGERIPLE